MILGFLNTNRAINGDLVAIELCENTVSPDSITTASNSITTDSAIDNDIYYNDIHSNTAASELHVVQETAEPSSVDLEALVSTTTVSNKRDDSDDRLNGRVVGIIKRNWRQYAGSLDTLATTEIVSSNNSNDNSTSNSFASTTLQFIPIDKSIPRILITTRRVEELLGKRLLVSMDQWPAKSQYPLGHYLRVLGEEGDKAVETQVILHEFDVPHAEFSPTVMACLPPPGILIYDSSTLTRLLLAYFTNEC